MTSDIEIEILRYKDEGKQLFNEQNFKKAAECYASAIKLDPKDAILLFSLYNNYAMCCLKLEDYDKCIEYTSKILKDRPEDQKARYRRFLAYKCKQDYISALKDAKILYESNNKIIIPDYLEIKEKLLKSTNIKKDSIVTEIFSNLSLSDKKSESLSKILSMSKEHSSMAYVLNEKSKLISLIHDTSVSPEDFVKLCHIFQNCLNQDIIMALDIPILISNHLKNDPKMSLTALYNLIIKAREVIRSLPNYKNDFAELITAMFKSLLELLLKATNLASYQNSTDDLVLKISNKNVCLLLISQLTSHESGFGMAHKLVYEMSALEIMLNFAAHSPYCYPSIIANDSEIKNASINENGLKSLENNVRNINQNGVKISQNTNQSNEYSCIENLALALNTIWSDMISDAEREEYRKRTITLIENILLNKSLESYDTAIKALIPLLQGPFYIGDSIVGTLNMTHNMIEIIQSPKTTDEQKIRTLDCVILTSSNRKRCQGFIAAGLVVPLKTLYKSPNEALKIRALMAISKLGASGGTDVSMIPFDDSSIIKVAQACAKFICSPNYDTKAKIYAVESLSYLSFNADIKEFIVNHASLPKILFQMAQSQEYGDSLLCPLLNLFVNVTNSYDKPSIEPELLDLAKQAKHHIPQESPKDSAPFVTHRVEVLMDSGLVNGLVPLCKTQSTSNRESLARIFLASTMDVKHRGYIIQQGGAKALLQLTQNNTKEGAIMASHALAKIFITNNPELSFPGEKYLDLVRPLITLLHIERPYLQNFEALMALTNIASISQQAKKRILLEHGMADIVNYLYDEDPLLRRASVECLCNLVLYDECRKAFCDATDDRVKMVALMILDNQDDSKLVLAASGALCTIVSNETALTKILEIKSLFDILKVLLLNTDINIKYRGFYIVRSLIWSSKEFAEKCVADDLYYVFVDCTRSGNTPKGDDKSKSNLESDTKDLALEIMEKLKEYGFVKEKNTK